MDYVDAYIERQLNCYITFKTMLCFCRRIARELGLKVDRLAKRNRNALLCWMAENWELIEPRIGDILLLLDKSNDEYSANNQDDEIEYDSSPEIKDEEPSPIETKKVIIPRIDEFIYSVGPTAGFI
ncbi:hypothetical protein TVAG_336090 [Trichomonas vaginalis G3]|uniref:Uncharacterized protein n=1 Tax=Trichomonas vaginalis (strain ATCC PRA-98 / G3) TaxID=412133 RepID=A2FN95_TRIV3|nr:hypothetical protein TVAGG3_0795500 [Trichomonas vaginalis G3]EAX93623.1 hypothetical protein TVAG_336090 [Trichomonas vaginalis G3]KAI5496136.1 hypothetical protein TVAGG3_0795500 [Trichomonas vaginalis G3]|eukprot:XP_001306553.1 hypothetical protein [Trichomonas vaginalis G3]